MNVNKTINKILIIVLCFTPFFMAPWPSDIIGMPRVIFIICATLLMVYIWIRYENDKLNQIKNLNLASKLGILYLLLIYISTFFSVDKLNSIIGISNNRESVVLLTCYVLIFLFSMTYLNFDKKKINMLLLSGVIMSIISVLQFFKIIYFESYSFPWGNFASPYGTLNNPNYLGAYITLILPISIYMYFSEKKPMYYFSSCLIFMVVLMSRTRGAWLGISVTFVILMMFFIKDKEHRKKIEVLVISFAFIAFALNLLMSGILVSRAVSIVFDFKEVTAPEGPAGTPGLDDAAGSYRMFIWKRVIETLPKHPLFGVGVGNLRYIFETYYTKEFLEIQNQGISTFQRAHNEFIHIAGTTGLPSLITYVLMLLSVVKTSFMKIQSSPISLALTASVIGYIIQSFFSNNVVYHSYMFWIILGAAIHKGTNVEKQDLEANTDDHESIA